MVEATEVSCNIWYALTGLATGGKDLVDYAARMGFGAPLKFDLPTAVSQVTNGDGNQPGGFVDDVELANAAYGQAETFVTPLQMALVASTIANGGELMQPRLVSSFSGKRGTQTIGPSVWRHVIDANDAATIRDGMIAAVEGDLGQRFTSGAKVPGRDDGREVRHRRARRHRRATLVVHRLRARRAPADRDRGPRRAGRSRRRGGGAHRRRPDDALPRRDRLVTQPDSSTDPDARTGAGAPADAGPGLATDGDPTLPAGEDRTPRPIIERIGLMAIALVLAALFGTVGVAAWSGGEPFLAAMGVIGCLMTIWVGAMTLFRG